MRTALHHGSQEFSDLDLRISGSRMSGSGLGLIAQGHVALALLVHVRLVDAAWSLVQGLGPRLHGQTGRIMPGRVLPGSATLGTPLHHVVLPGTLQHRRHHGLDSAMGSNRALRNSQIRTQVNLERTI